MHKCYFCKDPIETSKEWRIYWRSGCAQYAKKTISFCDQCASDMATFLNSLNEDKGEQSPLLQALNKIDKARLTQTWQPLAITKFNTGFANNATTFQSFFPASNFGNCSGTVYDTTPKLSFKTMKDAQRKLAKIQIEHKKNRDKNDAIDCMSKIVMRNGAFVIV